MCQHLLTYMGPVAGALLFLPLCLALYKPGSMFEQKWQPCVPYNSHKVPKSQLRLPTSFLVTPLSTEWSLDFTFTTNHWSLRLEPYHLDKLKTIITLSIGGRNYASDTWPANLFSMKDWTKLDISISAAGVLQVSVVVHAHQTFVFNAAVGDKCAGIGVQVYQMTAVNVSWDCSEQCIGKLVMGNQYTDVEGRNSPFFVMARQDSQLSFTMEIKDCLGQKLDVPSKLYTGKELNMRTGIWYKILLLYNLKGKHSFSITVDELSTETFISNREAFECDRFVKFKISAQDIFLSLSEQGCQENMYIRNNTWEALVDKCMSTTTAAAKIPADVSVSAEVLDKKLSTSEWSHYPGVESRTHPSSFSHSSVFTLKSTGVWVWVVLVGVLFTLTLSIYAFILTIRITSCID